MQRVARAAALAVPGIHALGTQVHRRLASALGRVPGATRVALGAGVNAETGPTQTAIDLTVVVEPGVDIIEVGRSLRRAVGDAVIADTGHTVVEVNVDVVDVHDPTETHDRTDQPRTDALGPNQEKS